MGMKEEMAEFREARAELRTWTVNRAKGWRNAFKPKYIWRWLVVIASIAILILLSHYHDRIVKYFQPHRQAIIDFPVSWLFPILILIVISFPPLFGHEIVLLVVGLIWGLWKGFGIAAAGTFIGELLCYFAFKYLFTARALAIEQKSVFYACLARLMREGGIWVIILVRFSVIPGHIVTAIQSTVGMPLWIYCIAVLVSLPKQLVVVYLGVLFGISAASGDSPAEIRKERIISLSVFFLTAIMTLIAAYVVYMRARRLYPEVHRLAEEREASAMATTGIPGSTEDPFNASEENLTSQYGYGGYGGTSVDIHSQNQRYGGGFSSEPQRKESTGHVLPPISSVGGIRNPFEDQPYQPRTGEFDQGHQEGGPFQPEEYLRRNGEPSFSPLPTDDSSEPWNRRS